MRRILGGLLCAALELLSAPSPASGPLFLASYVNTVSYQTPTYVQQAAGYHALTANFASAQNAGDLNVVAIGWDVSGISISSVVDSKGNTYAVAASVLSTTTYNQAIYYAQNIVAATAGANTITVTFSSATNPTGLDIRAAEYSGAAKSGVLDVTTGAVSTTGTALNSGNVTTTRPTDLLVGAGYVGGLINAVGSGYTQRILSAGGNNLQDQVVTSTGTYNATATQNTSDPWIMQIVAFRAAVGTPSPPVTGFGIAVGTGSQANKLIDQNGNVVQLRGVNMSGMEFSSVGGSTDPWGYSGFGTAAGSTGVAGTIPNIAYLLSQKVNSVRIPVNQESWLGYSNAQGVNPDPLNNYQVTLKKVVSTYEAAGLYVILDLHWSAQGNNVAGQQQVMADTSHSVAFWTSVASTFSNAPATLFELYNEPHLETDSSFTPLCCSAPSANTVLNSGGNYGLSFIQGYRGSIVNSVSGWGIAGYQTMLNAVRATGAKNVVLMGGTTYSNDETWWTSNKPTDSVSPAQIGEAHHNYNQGLTYDLVTNNAAAVSMLNAPGVPVVVTEGGDSNTSSSYITPLMAACDAQGYGFLAWAANPAAGFGVPNLTQTWNNSAGTATLTTSGTAFFNWTLNHTPVGVPPAAAAVGFNTLIFNSTTLGTTAGQWQPWNFYGAGASPFTVTQNGNGSFTMTGGGNSGAAVATAACNGGGTPCSPGASPGWQGIAFGGGFYAQATLSFTGQTNYSTPNGGPAFWMLDVEHTSQGPYAVNWPGTTPAWSSGTTYSSGQVVAYSNQLWMSATNGNVGNTPPSPGSQDNANWNTYNDFFETDMFEFDAASSSYPTAYQIGIGNWYDGSGTSTSNPAARCNPASVGSVCAPNGTNFASSHAYGVLWVPATGSGVTTTTQGYEKFYMDGVQIGATFTWNYYDPSDASAYPAPPPVNGSTAMSGMDFRHMFLILGSDVNQPTTVTNVQVWQVSGANNLVHYRGVASAVPNLDLGLDAANDDYFHQPKRARWH